MAGTTKLMTPGGGGVALTPASSIASDVTVSVPSQNCTLGIQGPAFRAELSSNQTLSNATLTKMQLSNEIYDTANCYDTSLYRWTPNVAGYYIFSAHMEFGTGTGILSLQFTKNGVRTGTAGAPNSTSATFGFSGAVQTYMNGTTDYIELYGYQSSGGNLGVFAVNCAFSGALVRAA